MNIGAFKIVDGKIFGYIATHDIDLPRVRLTLTNNLKPRAPKYTVEAVNRSGRVIELGALWEATTNSTGEVFLQGQVEDPSLAAPLPIALFMNDDGNGYRVAWSRPKPQQDGMTSAKAKRPARAAFGEGNANDSGQLTGQAAGGDFDDQREPF